MVFTWLLETREFGGQHVRKFGGLVQGNVRSMGAGGICLYSDLIYCSMVSVEEYDNRFCVVIVFLKFFLFH